MVPWRLLYGMDAPFAAPDLADRGQAPLLALRMLLLLAAALRLAREPGRAAAVRFAAVAALVVVSLLANVAFLPAAACAGLLIASWPEAAPRPAWKRLGGPGLALLLALVTAPLLAARGGGSADAEADDANPSPPLATTRALERGNLYEARFYAEQWARLETGDPRQGTLILARVEQQAGHEARARKIAADVAAHASSPAVRAQAQATLASLPESP